MPFLDVNLILDLQMEFTLSYKLLAIAWIICLLWVPFVVFTNRKVHPGALFLLFFVELWERFSYYGMRALLVLYMIDKSAELRYDEATAYATYAAYGAMVYATPIFGGLLAERILGYRRSILWGGILMALGQFLLAGPAFFASGAEEAVKPMAEYIFFIGLSFLILGNGFFKPNISSCVGQLYPKGDPNRDRGFNLFYMGINVGAFLAPITVGAIAEDPNLGWHWGFTVAGVGMSIGVILFMYGSAAGWLKDHGLPPEPERQKNTHFLVYAGTFLFIPVVWMLLNRGSDSVVNIPWGSGSVGLSTLDIILFALAICMMAYLIVTGWMEGKEQREKLYVVLFLFLFSTLFWTFFELAGSAINVFTEKNVEKTVGWLDSTPLSTSQFQGVNPLFIILFVPLFNVMWRFLASIKMEPSVPVKFAIGVILLGLGFFVFPWGATFANEGMVPLFFLLFAYLLHTLGELCLSPVGLSMVTKLSPSRIVAFVMGFWFLSSSLAHLLGKFIAQETASDDLSPVDALAQYSGVFWSVGLYAVCAGVFLLLVSPIVKKWMHGVN